MKLLETQQTFSFLCNKTYVTEGIVRELEIAGVIPDDIARTALNSPSRPSQAYTIFKFLQTSGSDADVPALLDALQNSLNKAAYKYLLHVSQSASQEMSSSVQPDPANGNASTRKSTVSPKCSEIAQLIGTDPGVVRDIKKFYSRFPKVSIADVHTLHLHLDLGHAKAYDVVVDVLRKWRTYHYSRECTIENLVQCLTKEVEGVQFLGAAETVDKTWVSTVIVERD